MSKTKDHLIKTTDRETQEPIPLGLPTKKPVANLGPKRKIYDRAKPEHIQVRMNPAAAEIKDAGEKNIVIHGYGTIADHNNEMLGNGNIEILLDDRQAASLAADIINNLSGPYLTTLYAGNDPQHAKIFKAFRHQFRIDVDDDYDAWDLANEWNPGQ